MTVQDVVRRVDALQYNAFPREEKVRWVESLEELLRTTILDTHREGTPPAMGELMAREPFDSLYLRWLEAQIHYHNGEIQRYNAAIDLFNAQLSAFESWYNRTHMPRGKGGFRG